MLGWVWIIGYLFALYKIKGRRWAVTGGYRGNTNTDLNRGITAISATMNLRAIVPVTHDNDKDNTDDNTADNDNPYDRLNAPGSVDANLLLPLFFRFSDSSYYWADVLVFQKILLVIPLLFSASEIQLPVFAMVLMVYG